MTAKTRADLLDQADTTLADNTTGEISPADVRGMAKDLADSALLPEDLPTLELRRIIISDQPPDDGEGADGTIWIQYE